MLSGKSFSDDKNKAETLLQDFSLFCYFACSNNNASDMSKSTYLLLPFGSLPDSNNIHYISSNLHTPILSAEKCYIKHFSAVMIANLVISGKEDEESLRFLALPPNV